jgi:hypothetical protein
MSNHSSQLLRLHESDNVLTVLHTLESGTLLLVGETTVTTKDKLPIGHKVAARAIEAGEKILKYGVPIGSANTRIEAGEHVHTHNIQSDYLPTIEREKQQQFFSEHP